MPDALQLRPGQMIEGPQFSEAMRIETVSAGGSNWTLGLVGLKTAAFRRVTLSSAELAALHVLDMERTFAGDGKLLALGVEAYALGVAYEFDPYFALSISRVDPLPHQLEAVYDYLLKLPRVKFLLADDAGAGKTIMAGLLIRELKLRGLIERAMVVCPANLAFQWQRELREKFDEKFLVLRGGDIREQFGVNQWLEQKQIITSLDLAKRTDVLPGLRQVRWDLIIIDEAHRMSAADAEHKTQRYRLGELLRDTSDHMLMLTATPHHGDQENFTFFLQLLDQDAYADVKSIKQAMQRNFAPFYLRRTKEAMVYFPERQDDGGWVAHKIFTRRIPATVSFNIDGSEFDLYREVTHFVKRNSERAAQQGDDPRARAVGFLMSLFQRRLASSTRALRRSLENRARRLQDRLSRAEELSRQAPQDLPDADEWDEMDDSERERLEDILEAVTIARNREQVMLEIQELDQLAAQAQGLEDLGEEAKLSRLKKLLQDEGFYENQDQRLLLFTEFKDTLDYLVDCLTKWGFRVGFIHGGMKPGSRDEPGSRLYAEQQFWDGATQILVATEAAGEGINLQCCHIMFNYDIPWNPNRLEQRMGRIHRYGQKYDCLIFNFVATNTIEGQVLHKLLEKLSEIRDALDDDAVFNVVGEVLPAAHIERVLRDYYAGRLGDADLEDRILRDVDEQRFRDICQNALEGLASKKLNLEMLIERRARAQERRVVPETVARFMSEAATYVPFTLRPVVNLPHTFDPAGATPSALHRYEREPDWRIPSVANRYARCSTDRDIAEKHSLEWVTPGHPLFEAIRRNTLALAQESFRRGASFYSLEHERASRIDIYRARVVDGLGEVIHERMFVIELEESGEPRLQEPGALGNLQPAPAVDVLPPVASAGSTEAWLYDNALQPFLGEIRAERVSEIERIAEHVELSLTELIQRADEQIGRFADAVERGDEGSKGLLSQAETRHQELLQRRDRRRQELARQKALTLQAIDLITSLVVLPHPDREEPDVRRLRPNPVVEAIAMRIATEHEEAEGRLVYDVHEKNLGYDLTSLDLKSGELRLIEVKGLGAATGTILLTPNEKRVAEDRRDCYWLYVVTSCHSEPVLEEPVQDPAQFPWHEVIKIDHYYLSVDAMTRPMRIQQEGASYNASPNERA